MIISLVIIALLFGGGGGLDLSNPEVIAKLERNIFEIIPDPVKARNVLEAVRELGTIDAAYRGETDRRVRSLIQSVGNPDVTAATVVQKLDEMDAVSFEENRKILATRDRMRQSMTKKEWKKLFKAAAKDE